MKLAPPFEPAGDHIAIDLGAARALFTTRHGGCSAAPYDSLNLGANTADDLDLVARNRARLAELAGAHPAFMRQVHAAGVVPADPAREPEADAQIASAPGIAPAALTADCLPIAVAGRAGVAIVHAGWRGLAAGVAAAAVARLRAVAPEGELAAAIGPGAGPCCYEVGDEVRAVFGPAAGPGPALDLKALAAAQLRAAGVGTVHDVGICTICDAERRFFSHRRDGGVTGRQAGLVWLT